MKKKVRIFNPLAQSHDFSKKMHMTTATNSPMLDSINSPKSLFKQRTSKLPP